MTSTDFVKIWETDNPPSRRWPLYTRGNVGEVFPEVVLPFSWSLLGQAAEDGWRQAFEKLGLVADGDLEDDEPMVLPDGGKITIASIRDRVRENIHDERIFRRQEGDG